MGAGTRRLRGTTIGAGTPVERRHSLLRLATLANRNRASRLQLQLGHRARPMHSPNALHSAGSNCLAAKAYPAADGWNMSWQNSTSGILRNSGASRVRERHWHAAGRSRTAGGLRSGQAQPASARHPAQRLRNRGDDTEVRAGADHDDGAAGRSRRTARPSRRADGPMPLSLVMSLAPIMITAASGGGPADEHRVDLAGQSLRRRADDRLGAQPDSLYRSPRRGRGR